MDFDEETIGEQLVDQEISLKEGDKIVMKQKLLAMLLCIVILLSSLPACAREDQDNSGHIVILYENDVHCAVDGYTKLAMLKNELKQSVPHVGVVSVGDYVQGGSLGSISKGEYVINLMNLVGYDA